MVKFIYKIRVGEHSGLPKEERKIIYMLLKAQSGRPFIDLPVVQSSSSDVETTVTALDFLLLTDPSLDGGRLCSMLG
jgi:hypothetical protein